jgi:hypothetical protein
MVQSASDHAAAGRKAFLFILRALLGLALFAKLPTRFFITLIRLEKSEVNKRIASFVVAAALVAPTVGCGGSSEPSNMLEDSSASDIEAYEAEMARQEAEMNASMANEELILCRLH